MMENMDPQTGDFVRPPTNATTNSTTPQDDAAANAATSKGRRQHEARYVRQLPRPSDGTSNKKKTSQSSAQSMNKRFIASISGRSWKRPDEEDDDTGRNCLFGNQIRFTIMAISTLCLSSILSNILTFNFTSICMAGQRPDNFSDMTDPIEWESLGYHPDLEFTNAQKTTLFMAVAVGALIAVFPMTLMLNKFGSRLVFGMLGLVSSIATLLMPLAVSIGFVAMIILRIIQGAAFSACLPVMGSITSHWSTTKQNGIFIAILSSFLQIAPIFTMPLSGELCESAAGWPSVYYVHGVVCLFLFIVFILYHRNKPTNHPMVFRSELVKVMFDKGSIYSGPGKQKVSKKVPYKAFYCDPAIWAILVSAMGNFMGTQLSLQFMPTYINRVLGISVKHTGIASAISPVIMFIIKILAGQTSDRIKFVSDQTKLRVYNSLALGGMGVLFILLGLLDPTAHQGPCLVLLIASTCVLGFNSGGFFKASQMVSRQHSHFTMANISFLNCVCMLIVPLINEVLAPDNSPGGWAVVLFLHGIVLIVTNAFFCLFCDSKAAEWTRDSWSQKNSKVAPEDGRAKRQSSHRSTRRGRSPKTSANKPEVQVPKSLAVVSVAKKPADSLSPPPLPTSKPPTTPVNTPADDPRDS